jgi:proteasome lid subunit RPN8/RPN11
MILESKLLQDIKQCVLSAGRREIAGYLMQKADGSLLFFLLRNVSPEALGFYISTDEDERAKAYARQQNYTIIAFLHSHVSPVGEMSQEDKEEFEQSDLPWVIVYIKNGDIAYEWYEKVVS